MTMSHPKSESQEENIPRAKSCYSHKLFVSKLSDLAIFKGKARQTPHSQQAINMPPRWLTIMLPLARWRNQEKYIPVSSYRDENSIDGEKGEFLPQERGSFSIASEDGSLPSRKPPQNTLHRLSIMLNIIFVFTTIALVAIAWPELVLKMDKVGNGLLKRTSRPCMSPSLQVQSRKL